MCIHIWIFGMKKTPSGNPAAKMSDIGVIEEVTTSHNFIERQIDERDSVLMTLIELT
jgi:hypothetical protein